MISYNLFWTRFATKDLRRKNIIGVRCSYSFVCDNPHTTMVFKGSQHMQHISCCIHLKLKLFVVGLITVAGETTQKLHEITSI